MSLSDLRHSLRKFDFPACAKEALVLIEQLLVGRSSSSTKQLDISMEIISEFMFCESDRRGSRRVTGLGPLHELQLIDVICNYLSACASETTKNTIFLSLFGGPESQRRLKVLSILSSMAVSASSTPVLQAVGVWLQQMGCSSPQSLQLAENIIRDHFFLNTSNQSSLKLLATTAQQFVANFIAAVTELYMQDVQGAKTLPPRNLLEVITSWVYTNPTLCMSAQLNSSALPSGSIPMAAVTPLAGLIRWCALAPLYLVEDTDVEMVEVQVPVKRIKLESEHVPAKQAVSRAVTQSDLYVKLHLGVLHSLRAGRRTHGPPTAVDAQRLGAVVPLVQAYTHVLLRRDPLGLQNDEKLHDCLDRIGQALQVALANGCIYGNISNLLVALDTLPESRLLRLVIKTHNRLM